MQSLRNAITNQPTKKTNTNQLIPDLNKKDRYTLCHNNKYDIPLIKNEKLSNSFIMRCCSEK